MEIGTVRQIDISTEMQGAYLDYAMSVIVSRALPDVRDGLKPVHRRILYAMYDMGLRPERTYKKSARIVGEVLGKYHPHGDAAVYEAMARMAQEFSLRYVLVDGQGNFGSIDGDSPAAMRYTEARLTAIAGELLADIDKQTVDFVPNFDDTLNEPAVLPAVLPNLLVNGASGIAVGMTTNIPPHNLAEVCDALVYLIDQYDKLDDVTVEDLTHFIQGPDFPTGGVIYRYEGEDSNGDRLDLIRNAYALGRGRFTIQANVHIEEMSRNRSRIVVTELPYQVNKTRLIERIAEMVRDGKIEGITDLRDESDRQGMRICIELTRTVEPREVLSQLFKLTPMQTTFGMAMLALVEGEPRLLPLKRVLTFHLEHRQEVIARRSRYLLEKAELRAHILEGLLRALDYIDEVIDIIRRSRTADIAQTNLMKRFRLSELQSQAILDMALKRLAGLERRNIAEEYREKLLEIDHLQGLLSSPVKIRQVIRDDLLALQAKYGDARRTRIVEREKGHLTARDLVEAEDVLVTLWSDGQACRTARAPHISSGAMPVAQVRGNTQDDVAFVTASGLAAIVPIHQLPDEQNAAVGALTNLADTEMLVGALILPHAMEDALAADTYLTLVTRGGRIKRITLADLSTASRDAMTVMNVDEGDQLLWIAETSGRHEILLVSRQGKAIRFSEDEVRPMGLSAAGVLAVKLGDDDAVVGMGLVRDGVFVITVTEQGYAKRTAVEDFPSQKRYGGGVQAAKLTERTGLLSVAALAGERDDVVLANDRGRVIKIPVKDIHLQGRAASGYCSPQGSKEPYVAGDLFGGPTLLTVLASSGPKAKPQGERAPGKAASRGRKRASAETTSPRIEAAAASTSSSTTAPVGVADDNAGIEAAPGGDRAPDEPVSDEATAIKDNDVAGPGPSRAAPSKGAPRKPDKKTTGRKPRTVRSVPKS